MSTTGKAQDAADKAEDAVATARDSIAFRVLVVVGLIIFGLIHLLVAGIAAQLVLGGGSSAPPNQQGALQALASTPVGPYLLWAVAIGLFTLVFWRIGLAIWGYSWLSGTKRLWRRLGSIGQAIVYAALGGNAMVIAIRGGSGGGGQSGDTLSAKLLSQPFGPILLLVVAAGIAVVGFISAGRGIRQTFVDDLTDGGGPILNKFGTVGHAAKGIALVIIGVLFGWAAFSHDPERAGGLDAAFKTVKDQPFGSVLLIALAAGLAAFGLFCFGWSRRARRS